MRGVPLDRRRSAVCRWVFLAVTAAGVMGLITGCAHDPGTAANVLYPPVLGDYPRSVAVLPFTDLTGTPEIAEITRVEFYGHLSTLPFDDVELHVIDDTLRRRRMAGPGTLSRISVRRLGRILKCDAVVFGSVYEFQRVFAGLYSSMNVGVSIQIWDTRTADIVWSDRYTARIHEGGLPLSVIDLPMITLRSGLNLGDTVKRHAVDEACRHLVRRIPLPRGDARKTSGAYTLQVGAFESEARAASLKNRFAGSGFPAFIRRSDDGRGRWHRVLLGPYRGPETALEVQRNLRKNYRTEGLLSKNRS